MFFFLNYFSALIYKYLEYFSLQNGRNLKVNIVNLAVPKKTNKCYKLLITNLIDTTLFKTFAHNLNNK